MGLFAEGLFTVGLFTVGLFAVGLFAVGILPWDFLPCDFLPWAFLPRDFLQWDFLAIQIFHITDISPKESSSLLGSQKLNQIKIIYCNRAFNIIILRYFSRLEDTLKNSVTMNNIILFSFLEPNRNVPRRPLYDKPQTQYRIYA